MNGRHPITGAREAVDRARLWRDAGEDELAIHDLKGALHFLYVTREMVEEAHQRVEVEEMINELETVLGEIE